MRFLLRIGVESPKTSQAGGGMDRLVFGACERARPTDLNQRLSGRCDVSNTGGLHVLVALLLNVVCRREPCETTGENVTLTKHGF